MNFSFTELLVIGVIAFMVLGPEEMIRQASRLGKFIHQAKNEINNLKIMAQEEIFKQSGMDAEEIRSQLMGGHVELPLPKSGSASPAKDQQDKDPAQAQPSPKAKTEEPSRETRIEDALLAQKKGEASGEKS